MCAEFIAAGYVCGSLDTLARAMSMGLGDRMSVVKKK